MDFLSALVAGVLFGTGLVVSRMFDPQRVLSFLDVAGRWDPALAFTMGGAVLVATPAFWYVRTRARDLHHRPVELPNRTRIDRALLLGSALFGIGWGMSGMCPGPGLLLLTTLSPPAVVFVGAMIVGFIAERHRPGSAAIAALPVKTPAK